ncbi:MAG: PTS system N-acetylgalactosamine-specific transporter subunit IIC [Syntrophus sp. PtaU1.Bin005]|nr:MAG: PTS system N-acetylgalactosamine-specific transporter subunit IIC [Syntrophus sp. PtaB.Bin138]OPY83214.1 MAG: PTS system N-acetylgalactosamine-specific transporter subunit IIC [Syntrophus sp. PtaU1.Bin005]
MVLQCLMISLLGGVICLDRIVIQSMIARPVVAAPLMGFFLGDPYTGLMIGAVIELFWIDRLPIGTLIPPNDSLAAILVTASCIISSGLVGHSSRQIMAFSLLIYLPCGYIGQKMDVFFVSLNDRLARAALRSAEKADLHGVQALHLLSLLIYLCLSVCFLFFFLWPGIAATAFLFPLFSPSVLEALNIIFFFFPLLGIAVALNTIHLRGMVPVFCCIFLLASMILEIGHVL